MCGGMAMGWCMAGGEGEPASYPWAAWMGGDTTTGGDAACSGAAMNCCCCCWGCVASGGVAAPEPGLDMVMTSLGSWGGTGVPAPMGGLKEV